MALAHSIGRIESECGCSIRAWRFVNHRPPRSVPFVRSSVRVRVLVVSVFVCRSNMLIAHIMCVNDDDDSDYDMKNRVSLYVPSIITMHSRTFPLNTITISMHYANVLVWLSLQDWPGQRKRWLRTPTNANPRRGVRLDVLTGNPFWQVSQSKFSSVLDAVAHVQFLLGLHIVVAGRVDPTAHTWHFHRHIIFVISAVA